MLSLGRLARAGQVSVETALLMVCVVSALAFLSVYVQRAEQGGLLGAASALGLQYDPRDNNTEVQTMSSSETMNFVSRAAMVEARTVPGSRVVPLGSVPSSPVPREPALGETEVTSQWQSTSKATYIDVR